MVDAQAKDRAFVAGDVAALRAVWQRCSHAVTGPVRGQVDAGPRDLAAGVTADDLGRTTTAASRPREVLTAAGSTAQ